MACNADINTICNTLEFLPICILSKDSIEVICFSIAWSNLLSNSWLDVFEKDSQDKILNTITTVSDKDIHSLVCPMIGSEHTKQILFQFHVLTESNSPDVILILATDITSFIGYDKNETLYTLLLSELVRHPSHDKRIIVNLFAIRQLLHDMTRLINTSLNEDNANQLMSEMSIEQQLDDLRAISENTQSSQKLGLTRQDLRRILEDTSIMIGVQTIIEKRFDKSTNVNVLVDSGRITTLLENVLRKLHTQVSSTANKIIIEASVTGQRNNMVLLIKYMYVGNILTLTDDDPSHVMLKGYMDILSASFKSEQIGSRIIMTLNIPIVSIYDTTVTPETQHVVKVGVVDDNNIIRRFIKTYGEKYGHVVYEGSNGKEAVDMVQKERPDILFLDINIPIFDGFEVIRRIRQWEQEQRIEPKTRIVVVTGFGEKYTKEMIIEAGADTSQEKPMTIDRYKTYIDIFTQL